MIVALGLAIPAVAARRVGGSGAPSVTSAPSISSATPTVGDVLTGSVSFSGATSVVYMWKRRMASSPFTETVFAAAGTSFKVPPIAATELLLFGATATNAAGSTTVWSSPTSAVAQLYMVSTTSAQRGMFGTRLWYSTFSGPLVNLIINNTTAQDFSANSKGLLDYDQVIAWRDSVSPGAVMRVASWYNQSSVFPYITAANNISQATDNSRGILDPNNYDPETGIWDIAINGYNARGETPAGVTVNEINLLMSSTGVTYTSGSRTFAVIGRAVSNIGIAASNAQNCVLGGISTSTTRSDLMIGDTDTSTNEQNGVTSVSYSRNVGLGAALTIAGPTITKYYSDPAIGSRAQKDLTVPNNRHLLMVSEHQTINTPEGGVAPLVALEVNDRKVNFTTTGRSNTSTSGLRIGAIGVGTAATGTAYLYSGIATFGNALHAAGTDERVAVRQRFYDMFAIKTNQTTKVAFFDSSTGAGYRSNANGIPSAIQRALPESCRVESFSKAGSAIGVFTTNKTFLAGLRDTAYAKNFAILYGCRNGAINGQTGAAMHAEWMTFCTELKAQGFDQVFLVTQVPSKTGGTLAADQAGYDAVLAAFNTEVVSPSNQSTYGYIAIDVRTAPAFDNAADFSDTAQYDFDGIHQRQDGSMPAFASIVAAAIAPYVS